MTDVAPSVLDRLRALLASRYIDDGIDRMPTAVNLVPNGSFEHDTIGLPPAGWVVTSPITVQGASWTTSDPPSSGAKALQTPNTAQSWSITQDEPSPVTPGVSYTARLGYFQNSSNTNGWDLYIRWLREDGSLISSSNTHVGNVSNGGLGVATVAGVAPADAASAYVEVIHLTDISGMYFDAFMLAPTAQGTTYVDGSTAGADWFWQGTVGNSISQTPHFPPSSDQILEAIIGGIADGAERLGIVAFGNTDVPVGRALTDPSVAPDWALPHAALYTSGGLLPGKKAGEADADWLARARDAAVYPLGIKAGTNEAIVRTVQPLLTGTKTVFITVGADPYTVVVRTLPAETPDQAAVAAAITGSFVSGGFRGALRAELALDYTVSNSPEFSEATRTFTTVTATATSTNVTRTDVT